MIEHTTPDHECGGEQERDIDKPDQSFNGGACVRCLSDRCYQTDGGQDQDWTTVLPDPGGPQSHDERRGLDQDKDALRPSFGGRG